MYSGTTYEGLKNYTAYHSSQFSGWSTHLAVASAQHRHADTLVVRRRGARRTRRPGTRRISHRARAARHGRAAAGGRDAATVAEDGSDRPAHRRHRARLQQSADGGHRQSRHDPHARCTATSGCSAWPTTRSRQRAEARSSPRNCSRSRAVSAWTSVRSISQQLLNGMSGLLSQSVGPSVRVDVRIDDDARFAISDANQLELALLNLAVNARDAMPERRHARRSRRTLVRDAERGLPARRAGSHRYRVGHDGGSASACDRAVLHDQADRPGHRPRPVAGVRRRAGIGRHARDRQRTRTRHDGAHDPSRRALRRSCGPTTSRSRRRPRRAVRSQEQKRVLVVDDDRLVRRFMADSLRSLQYHVMEVENGDAGAGGPETRALRPAARRFRDARHERRRRGARGAGTSARYQRADGLRLCGQRRGRSCARQLRACCASLSISPSSARQWPRRLPM